MSPGLAEIDLSAWRPDHEVADRAQIENSAALMVEDLKVSPNRLNAALAYQVLTELAPEFLKDFLTSNGLAINGYWRDAVGRAGEPRSDRKTVPIIGPLYSEENTTRLLNVLEYGLRDKDEPTDFILTVAPQTRLWGATTQQRDSLSFLKQKIEGNVSADRPEVRLVCLFSGRPPRCVESNSTRFIAATVRSFRPPWS